MTWVGTSQQGCNCTGRCLTTSVRCAAAPKKFIKKPAHKRKRAKGTAGNTKDSAWQTSTLKLKLRAPPTSGAPAPAPAASSTPTAFQQLSVQKGSSSNGLVGNLQDGFPEQEMVGGLVDWEESFVLPNAIRRQQLAAKRQALFGRGWRQRDVRYYFLRRAKHTASNAALLAEAGPQLASARAAVRQQLVQLGIQQHDSKSGATLAPIPHPRLERQRGDGPFDDSLPLPATFFKLPARWRCRVLAERLVHLRSILPSVAPTVIIQLYSCAPVLLCCTTRTVATQIHAVSRALDVHPNVAAQHIAACPVLGLVNPDHLQLKAASIASRYNIGYWTAARCIACSNRLMSSSVSVLGGAAQQLAQAVQCSEQQAMAALLEHPDLLDVPRQQLEAALQALAPVFACSTRQRQTPQQQQQQQQQQGTAAGTGALPGLQQLMVDYKGPERRDLHGVHSCVLQNPLVLLAPPEQLTQMCDTLSQSLHLTPSETIHVLLQPGVPALAPGLLYRRMQSLHECVGAASSTGQSAGDAAELQMQQVPALPVEWVRQVVVAAPRLLLWPAMQVKTAVDAIYHCCAHQQHTVEQLLQVMGRSDQDSGCVQHQPQQHKMRRLLGACLSANPWLLVQVLNLFNQLQLEYKPNSMPVPTLIRRGPGANKQLVLRPKAVVQAWVSARSRASGDQLPLLPSGKRLPDASWCYPHPAAGDTAAELLRVAEPPIQQQSEVRHETSNTRQQRSKVAPGSVSSAARAGSQQGQPLSSQSGQQSRQQQLMLLAASRVMSGCAGKVQSYFGLSSLAGGWVLLLWQPGLLMAPGAAWEGRKPHRAQRWDAAPQDGPLIRQDVAADRTVQDLVARIQDAERSSSSTAAGERQHADLQPAVQQPEAPTQDLQAPVVDAANTSQYEAPERAQQVKRRRGYLRRE